MTRLPEQPGECGGQKGVSRSVSPYAKGCHPLLFVSVWTDRGPETRALVCEKAVLGPALSAYMLSHFSHIRLFATPRTVVHQALLSMGFSRQEYWSGLPCSPSGDLPDLGIKPASLMSPALTGGFFNTSAIWEACFM